MLQESNKSDARANVYLTSPTLGKKLRTNQKKNLCYIKHAKNTLACVVSVREDLSFDA